jgi:hypothetical protein
MEAKQVQFNPSDLSDEQIQRIARAVSVYVLDSRNEPPMDIDETGKFLKRSRRQINKLRNMGTIVPVFLEGDARPYYLKSDILKRMKPK